MTASPHVAEGATRRSDPIEQDAVPPGPSVRDRGFEKFTPLARRANDRLRSFTPLAQVQDRIGLAWAALIEAFCQAVEPMLERRFPDIRLIVVADASGGLILHKVSGDGARAIGGIDALAPKDLAGLVATRWSAVELRLPASQVLERKLSLPASSRQFIAPILEHRLDRLTPWRPERVLYGYRTQDDPTIGGAVGSIAVTLTATSRDLVAGPLQRLRLASLDPTAICADTGAPELPMSVNLLGGGAAPPRAESRRFVSKVMLAVCGTLLVAWMGTAVVGATAERDHGAATQKLVKARRLLRAASFGNLGSREQAMLEAKQPARSMVVLIDRLSTSIPADTYLKDLTIQADKVRLVGSSGNAPALVGELEAAGLANVRFTSTITRDKAGRDDFELSADRPQKKVEDTP